ncbi:MAG: DUF3710 domain-containing protein [Nocardioidaceae bacterium]
MKFGRRKNQDSRDDDGGDAESDVPAGTDASAEGGAGADAAADPADEGRPSPRAGGPWDDSEIEVPDDDGSYVDLGGLIVKGRPGFELQIPTDSDSGLPRAVVLVTEDSAVEVLAFAATRSGGLWDEIRPEIIEEVERLQGKVEQVEGSFGTELQVQVPVQTSDGKSGTQPSRIIGVEGPRWLLRATFMGREALEPAPDGVLESALRDVIVVRGKDPMAPREQIGVTLPEGAVRVDGEDDQGENGQARPV